MKNFQYTFARFDALKCWMITQEELESCNTTASFCVTSVQSLLNRVSVFQYCLEWRDYAVLEIGRKHIQNNDKIY